MIWYLNRLRPYLLSIRFTIRTDCQALIFLNFLISIKQLNRRLRIEYRPGTRMGHVDAFSRMTHIDVQPKSVDAEISEKIEVFTAMTKQEAVRLMQATISDPHV
ncbi:Uncharacterized protein FWK35_00009920 [Aphis craccivora]|uniref:Reverse transcriptase RNase H-like domain-containing protein n=1 Tax=Aphis craccivora TaxID=307492 RepID=A0A6G0ZF09_APHCR|nr:Uncharacterized protein FWK35_00009920 [Aphis craccivora]